MLQQNETNPLSPKEGDKNIDDDLNDVESKADETDSIDGDIKSHSGSGSHLRLETDHHHIPDAITYQRDIKSKAASSIYGLKTAKSKPSRKRELIIDQLSCQPFTLGHRKAQI